MTFQYKPTRKAAPATTAGGDGVARDPSRVAEHDGVAPYHASDGSISSSSAGDAPREGGASPPDVPAADGSASDSSPGDAPRGAGKRAPAPSPATAGPSVAASAALRPRRGMPAASILAMELDVSDADRPSLRGMSGVSFGSMMNMETGSVQSLNEDDDGDDDKSSDAGGEISAGDEEGGDGDGVLVGDGLAKNKNEGDGVPYEEESIQSIDVITDIIAASQRQLDEGEDEETGGRGGPGEGGRREGRADGGPRHASIAFGTASNIRTGSFLRSLEPAGSRRQDLRRGSAEIVAAMVSYDLEDSSESATVASNGSSSQERALARASELSDGTTFRYRAAPRPLKGDGAPPPQAREQPRIPRERRQPKGVLRQSKYGLDSSLVSAPDDAPAPRPIVAHPSAAAFQLSLVSQQYDLDGNGVLDDEERAMRDRDLAARGLPIPDEGGLKPHKLSLVSRQYDLDGDGKLDEVEQAMRDRDCSNRGILVNEDVKDIIRDEMKSREDYGLYKRAAAVLVCLVFVLALSNFGTSWASAALAKDTVVDGESGTIVSKRTGEAVGFQEAAHVYDLKPLSDEEFERRRLLVDAEMAEDPDHPDHLHRRLGRKKNKKKKGTKIAYDHGVMRQQDVADMAARCDLGNIVNLRRIWREDDLASIASDAVCEPGTQVVRKGKKNKKNKKKTKTKEVDDSFEFRNKGEDGRDNSVVFDCERGYCWGSGGALLQPEGHPCRHSRDGLGASECEAGLVCYVAGLFGAGRGVGVCTSLEPYARKGQLCDMDLLTNACVAGLACRSTNTGNFSRDRRNGDEVRTGTCQVVPRMVERDEVCDVAFGQASCVAGYQCLGANGRDVGRRGIGLCTRNRG